MANIKQCAGQAIIRVGGNTQETATLVPHTSDGKMITKDQQSASNPTQTPILDFTADLIYMLGNISALMNTKWYLGIPFQPPISNCRGRKSCPGQAPHRIASGKQTRFVCRPWSPSADLWSIQLFWWIWDDSSSHWGWFEYSSEE